MKKKIIIIASCIVVVAIITVLIILLNKPKYTIRISKVDDQSPDRILTVYNDKNEEIEVSRIEYLDGKLLCNGYNTTVHYGNIENEKKLMIVLRDKSKVVARIIKEEVE